MDILNFVKKNIILLVLFVGIPIILIFGYIYVKYSFEFLDYLQRRNKEYTMVKESDRIVGVLISLYSDRGCSFVELNDSSKIWFEVSENKRYSKHMLYEFLQPSDSLIKWENSDTLYIYRRNEVFFFVLGELN